MQFLFKMLPKLSSVRKLMACSSREKQRVMRRSIVYGFSAMLAVFCLIYLQVIWAERSFGASLSGFNAIAQGQANAWTSNGPEGGTITAFAIAPNNTSTLYAGTNRGSVFKTTNGGANWSLASVVVIGYSIETLAIDPSNPNIIYAGTLNQFGRGGVFKSTDGGSTWRAANTGLPTSTNSSFFVKILVVDPISPLTLYLGTDSRGVFKSINGGTNWNPINSGLAIANILALAVDPRDPSTIYAGTGGGIFKSTDGGGAWSPANTGLSGSIVIQTLAIDPSNSSILYAGNNRGEIFRSADKGASWSRINNGFIDVGLLVVDPKSPSILYSRASRYRDRYYSYFAVYKSTDGGLNWSPVNSGLPDITVINVLTIDPNNSSILYVGAAKNDGVFKSADGGANWRPANSGLTATVVQSLAIVPSNPNTIYAATLGTYGGGLFKSTNGGAIWSLINNSIIATTIQVLAVDPNNPSTLYAGIDRGGVFKSTDGGVNWRPVNNGFPLFSAIFDPSGSFPPTIQALAIDPINPFTIYAGTLAESTFKGGVYKSMDSGENWSAVNSGLPNFTRVMSLAIDQKNPSMIYAGTNGGVFKSISGGSIWNPVGPGVTGSFINALVIDSINTSILYAVTSGGGVFKSANGGANWSPANNGLPSPAELPGYIDAQTLAIDPRNPSTVYVGTGMANINNTVSVGGVFRSTNGGLSWSEFNDGLTYPDVRAMAVPSSGGSLHVATNGGGVFDIQLGLGCSLTCTATVPTAGMVGTPVSFSATATPSGCTGAPTYDWDFGDGSPHPAQQNVSHVYTAPGNYNWKLTVSVNGLAICTRNGTIRVSAPCSMPTISFIEPPNPAVSNIEQQVTVNGANFKPGLTVTVTYPGGSRTLSGAQILQPVTSTSFKALITFGSPGDWSIHVNNPDCSQSTTFPFKVGSSSCAQPPSGLVAWWPGDGNANDIQGGNNGALQLGSTTTTGFVGQAFNFNGFGDSIPGGFVSIPDSANLRPSALTFEGWFFLRQRPTGSPISGLNEFVLASKYDGQYHGWVLRVGNDLKPVFSVHRNSNPGGLSHSVSSVPVQLNTWVYIAGTYDGNTARIYVNGSQTGSQALTGGYTPATVPMKIGTASWYTGGFTDGLADEAAVYNRALTSAEIQSIFASGSAGKCKGTTPPCTLSCTATASPNGIVGTSVSFSATATPSGCTTAPTYDWDFGDSSLKSSQQNPGHTYAAPGTYSWKLTVRVNGASQCVRPGTIRVSQGCMIDASIAPPTEVFETVPVVFSSLTKLSDCNGIPMLDWDFGDGELHSTIAIPSHTYKKPGEYTWTLTISVPGTGSRKFQGTIRVKRLPVLFIPGVYGTYLYKGSELLWLDPERVLGPRDTFLDPLQFTNQLEPDDKSVVPNGVITKLPFFDYTEGLVGEFNSAGYKPGELFFAFPYDWRYGVSDRAVNDLRERIGKIKEITGSPKVHVIAHSTGGLLIKKYVKTNEGHSISKAVFLGVPNIGAPKAPYVLLTGDTGLTAVSWIEMKKLARNLPIVYDLAPSMKYGESYLRLNTVKFRANQFGSVEKEIIDSKNLNFGEAKEFLSKNAGFNETAFNDSVKLHQSLDDFDLRSKGIELYSFCGCKSPTIGPVVVEMNDRTRAINVTDVTVASGDGTVPLQSSISLAANRRFFVLKADHGKLPSADSVRQSVVNIIANTSLSVSQDVITQNADKCKIKGELYNIYSPVNIEVLDRSGKAAMIVTNDGISNDIPGASYNVFDDHKSVFLPTDEGQTYSIKLKGSGVGTFTIKIDKIEDDQTTKAEIFPNITVTTSLLGQIKLQNGLHVLELDKNGDGVVDQSVTPPITLDRDQLINRSNPNSGSVNLRHVQASPSSGTYSVPQMVALSAPDWDMIYYTTNGSTPSLTNGVLYTKPIAISKTTTIKAIAYLADGVGSEVFGFFYTLNILPPTTIAPGILITEFRFSGVGGNGDWFVELYNNTDAPLSTNGRVLGFTDANGSVGFSFNLTANKTIPARGYYLVAGPNYSLANLATPDQSVPALPLNSLGGVGVFSGAINTPATRLDSVALASVGANAAFAHFREGVGLASVGATMAEHSWLRKLVNGLPQDTNNNQADFVLLSPAGNAISGVAATLGAVGPQSSTSPATRNNAMADALFDPGMSANSPPNRVRNGSPVANGALGTLALRRTFTNNAGKPITRLRFRVVDITNKGGGGEAELRVLNSVNAVINGKQVRGLTLEQPPAQPVGGGLNSTLAVGVITLASPLPAGASINVEFLLGVMRGGNYRFFVNVEALP